MDRSLYLKFYEVERAHWWFLARREILYSVLDQFVAPEAKILDAGCGTGFFIERAKERFQSWGVDSSPLAVSMCHERGLDKVFVGSALDLASVSDKTFDAILLLDVIEHVEDDFSALRHAKSLLAPNGVVIITVPAFMFMWSEHDELNLHKRRYVRVQLHNLLRDTGFSIEKLTYFNSYLFPLAVLVRLGNRLFRRRDYDEFAIPGATTNKLMKAVFLAEKKRLLKPTAQNLFPFGLSLLAVGRKAAD